MQLFVVTPTPSLRHDGGNQAPNANKCERKRPGTNLLANPPSPDVVKWVKHNRPTFLQPGYEQRGTAGLVVFMGNWYSPHVALWACVCWGEEEGREAEARIQQGCPLTWMSPSSHHHPPLRRSAPPLEPEDQETIPGTPPVPLHCSSVWGKKERTKPQRG